MVRSMAPLRTNGDEFLDTTAPAITVVQQNTRIGEVASEREHFAYT